MTLYAHLVEVRRPPAIVHQQTELMPAVSAATSGGPAPADPVLTGDWLAWGPLDLVAAAIAIALGAGAGRHRYARGCVRRRGIWRRPNVRVIRWDEVRDGAR